MRKPRYADPSEARRSVAELIRAPNRALVAQSIADNMRVPQGAATSTAWDPDLTGYMVEPINCLTSRDYDAVIFVGPSRTGKTVGLVDGWAVYMICNDPCDMAIVQMTQDKARKYSQRRLQRMFRASPEIRARLSPNSHDNNVHDITFRSGAYLAITWPTVNSLAGSDYKYIALTDFDRWPLDIGGEGSGDVLAFKRVQTFMSSGMAMIESSPGHLVKDPRWRGQTSHEAPPCDGIMKLYNQGDRRRLYWPCPHPDCGHYFQPDESNTHWPDPKTEADPVKASEAAHIVCPHCLQIIEPWHKPYLNKPDVCVWLKEGETITASQWQQAQPDQMPILLKHGIRGGTPRRARFASFWMEGPAAAYQTLTQLVYNRIQAERTFEQTGSQEELQARINTDWGRPYIWQMGSQEMVAEELLERAEALPKRQVPRGVRFLVAAVDVQAGKRRRFVVQIIGYGRLGERWLIDRYNLKLSARHDEQTGEVYAIEPAAFLEDWDLLETEVMNKSYLLMDDSGRKMPILVTACDSGGEDGVTDNAYRFWRKMRRKGRGKQLFLVKGGSHDGALIKESYPDNTGNSRRRASARGDVPLYLLNTNAFKDKLDVALKRPEPGPNYLHHPDWLGLWFFKELTAEQRDLNGKWSTVSSSAANEAIDCYNYAHAAVLWRGYDKIDWATPPSWAKDWDDNPNLLQPYQAVRQYREQESSAHSASNSTNHHNTTTNNNHSNWLNHSGEGWL